MTTALLPLTIIAGLVVTLVAWRLRLTGCALAAAGIAFSIGAILWIAGMGL